MKLYKYITVACLLFLISACKETILKEKPLDFYSPENSFTTPADIESALFVNYYRIRWILNGYEPTMFFHAGTDLGWSARNPSFDYCGDYAAQMTPSASFVATIWNTYYRIIYDDNVVLNRLQSITYPSESAKNAHIAEARFFRGYAYKQLVNLYGGVPLVLEEVASAKRDFKRATKEAVIDQAISDMEFAAANLPSVVNVVGPGRASNAAALHYLSELYISKGLWDKAVEAATTVINDPNISLMTTRFGKRATNVGDPYWDLFQRFNQNRSAGNKEGILVLQTEFNVAGGFSPSDGVSDGFLYERVYGPLYWQQKGPDGVNFCFGATTQQGGRAVGLLRPSTYYTHTIWGKGNWNVDIRNNERNIKRTWDVDNTLSTWFGKNTSDFPQSWYNGLTAADTMIRFYPLVTKITTKNDHPAIDIANIATGWMDGNAQYTRSDWYLIRVAETYLLRAEAKLGKGDKQGAADDINALRNRAGAIPVTSGEVNIDYILDERMRELNYEENRRATLGRLGLVYARTVKGNPFSGATIKEFNNLMPIPFAEIERNTGAVLDQNTGYH